jgi:hypothetical protein
VLNDLGGVWQGQTVSVGHWRIHILLPGLMAHSYIPARTHGL